MAAPRGRMASASRLARRPLLARSRLSSSSGQSSGSELDHVPIRVRHVGERSTGRVLTTLYESAACGDNLLDRLVQRSRLSQPETKVVDAAGAAPGVSAFLKRYRVLGSGRPKKDQMLPVPEQLLETEHLLVERLRTLDVRDQQVDVR